MLKFRADIRSADVLESLTALQFTASKIRCRRVVLAILATTCALSSFYLSAEGAILQIGEHNYSKPFEIIMRLIASFASFAMAWWLVNVAWTSWSRINARNLATHWDKLTGGSATVILDKDQVSVRFKDQSVRYPLSAISYIFITENLLILTILQVGKKLTVPFHKRNEWPELVQLITIKNKGVICSQISPR